MIKLSQIFTLVLLSASLYVSAGSSHALSGTYTIGKNKGADFLSVTEAVNAAVRGGIKGHVTFNIESGTYNERVLISKIPGASANNTIVIQSKTGNSTDAIISYDTTDATVIINGASFISFENISVNHDQAATGNAMRVDGKAGNLHFKGVTFNGVDVTGTGANCASVYFTPSAAKNNISFEDCEINNGSVGIFKGGNTTARDTKTSITGTLFYAQYQSAIVLNNENAPVLSNNAITSLSGNAGFIAINLDNISNALVVSNNIIVAGNGKAGIALNNCFANAAQMGQVNGNSIALGSRGATCGILLTGSTDNQVLNFNRVKLTNGTMAANQAYYQNAGNGNNINAQNNVVYNLKTNKYTMIGNANKGMFNQLPGQNNNSVTASLK